MTDGDAGGVMVVTGASRGIGAAIARLAGGAGWKVCVHYASAAEAAARVVADIEADGGTAFAHGAEIADAGAVAGLFDAVDRRLGRVTALVNNAGVIAGQANVADLAPEAVARVLMVNVAGAYHATGEAVRRMARSRGGAGGGIVNLSSLAAKNGGLPGESHYAASKAALDAMTMGLSRELAGQGIRVNAVRPGIIDTDIHDAHGGRAFLERFVPNIPAGRVGTPEEVARVVLWLLSKEADYVTGALMDVTGGR